MRRFFYATILSLLLLGCTPRVQTGPVLGSVADLESVWETDKGERIAFRKFLGEKLVLSVFYVSCKTVCPMVVRSLKDMESDAKFRNEKFLLVDIDSKDGVRELKDFKKRESLSDRWILVRGSESDVRELSTLLEINYRSNGGEIEHSVGKFEISKSGEIRRILDVGKLPE